MESHRSGQRHCRTDRICRARSPMMQRLVPTDAVWPGATGWSRGSSINSKRSSAVPMGKQVSRSSNAVCCSIQQAGHHFTKIRDDAPPEWTPRLEHHDGCDARCTSIASAEEALLDERREQSKAFSKTSLRVEAEDHLCSLPAFNLSSRFASFDWYRPLLSGSHLLSR
jgi:hypothetical protein